MSVYYKRKESNEASVALGEAARLSQGALALFCKLLVLLVIVVGALGLGLCSSLFSEKAYASLGQTEGWGAEGAYDTSWYSEGQTSFAISNASQLAGLAHLVNINKVTFSGCTITLANNIDVSGRAWAPIGTPYTNSASSFQGTFDGGGHTITGLTIDNDYDYQALFGNVKNALIRNLVVKGSVTAQSCVAGIVAWSSNSSFQRLANYCTVTAKGTTTATNEVYFGSAAGVVCYAATSSSTQEQYFQDLYNYGLINAGDKNTGGVIGFLYSNGKVNVSRCANYNNVNVGAAHNIDADDDGVGGVIGSTAGYGTYAVSECVNTGTITVANATSTGGIVGSLGGEGSSVTMCRNSGQINGASYAGGIAGNVRASDGQVVSCYNTGKVNAASTSGSGGIVASQTGSNLDVRNNFYLSGTAGSADAEGSAEALSKTEMQSSSVIDQLNLGGTFFETSSGDGFATLSWESTAQDGTSDTSVIDQSTVQGGESVFESSVENATGQVDGTSSSENTSTDTTSTAQTSSSSSDASAEGGNATSTEETGDAATEAQVTEAGTEAESSEMSGEEVAGSEATMKLVELEASAPLEDTEDEWSSETSTAEKVLIALLVAFMFAWGVLREKRLFCYQRGIPFLNRTLKERFHLDALEDFWEARMVRQQEKMLGRI